MKRRLVYGASAAGLLAGLALATGALAQTATPSAAPTAQTASATPAKPGEPIEEITVTASKSSGTRIDRRVYDIKTDPQATTGQLSDVLSKVPSVTVTPDDKVYLRGDSGVTIWVDGKPPAEGKQVLRMLPASEIERIEVITNPSAQYAAATSKGIINIITKKPRGKVVRRGSASLWAHSRDRYGATLSYDDGKGPWSWGLNLSANGGPTKNRSFSTRDYINAQGQVTGRLREEGISIGDNQWRNVGLRGGYKLGPRSALKLKVRQSEASWTGNNLTAYDDSAEGKTSERSYEPWFMRLWAYELNYTFADDKGERLTVEVSDELNHTRDSTLYEYMGASTGTNRVSDIQRDHGQEIKADYEKPLGGNKLLSAGFDWQRQRLHMARSLDSDMPGLIDYDSRFAGRQTTAAAYVTLQWPLSGKWTAMPGLRVEDRRRDIAGRRGGETEWFPSLHLSRAWGEDGKIRFSYSRRLDPINLGQYDPQILRGSLTWAQSGNPDLALVLVNSLEASYDWEHKDSSWGASVFMREASNAIENVNTLIDGGVILSRPVNRGQTQYAGFDVNWRFPVKRLPGKGRWSHSGSASFTRDRSDSIEAGGSREATFWMLKPMVQYDGPKRAGLSGDQYQFSATVMQNRGLQSRSGVNWSAEISWSHPLNKKLTLVATGTNLLGRQSNETRTVTARYRTEAEQFFYNRAVKLALNYKFGN
ncbi:TonB-dependent receptor [Asticcacaulis sp.]|uniref:TonB-dependent receptor n=1 Tax=Asticcacaulis sp. TaxID=1872648 RepID=UPI00391DDFE0